MLKSILSDTLLILSASRTKDMVHRSPGLLADILLGKAPCRWGPHGPSGIVDPASLHTVVLWTKDPANILNHPNLKAALLTLHNQYGVQISLQLTATGLGGSLLEPGIALWREVRDTLAKILAEGWIHPEAVIYRYDPFLSVHASGGEIFSNADLNLFQQVCGSFLDLGLRRVTTSRADIIHYPRVAERLRCVGLEWIVIADQTATNLCRAMDTFCRSRGADFSVCCDPAIPGITDTWGCIDARWLNRIKGESYPPATEVLHNRIGKQRPACRCTYSRDIGYSSGSQGCYSGGFGCLYCYAQGNALPPEDNRIRDEIAGFGRSDTPSI